MGGWVEEIKAVRTRCCMCMLGVDEWVEQRRDPITQPTTYPPTHPPTHPPDKSRAWTVPSTASGWRPPTPLQEEEEEEEDYPTLWRKDAFDSRYISTTHPPNPNVQSTSFERTSFSSSIHPPTHPPTHPDPRPRSPACRAHQIHLQARLHPPTHPPTHPPRSPSSKPGVQSSSNPSPS